jgi:hypothetical protein
LPSLVRIQTGIYFVIEMNGQFWAVASMGKPGTLAVLGVRASKSNMNRDKKP